MTKLLSAILAAGILFPSAAVVDIFARHEAQMNALRCCDGIIEVIEETPEDDEDSPAVPSVGIGREAYEPAFEATADELEQLVVLCYLEAGGESDECVRAVAEVVFNRLSYGAWGDTLTDVIYAPGEFEPAAYIAEFETGGNLIVEDRLDEIRDIVWDVYNSGVSIPERVMFFRADYYHTFSGAVDEFAVGNVFFSSSRWCE